MRINYLSTSIQITHVSNTEPFLRVANVAVSKAVSHSVMVTFVYTGLLIFVFKDAVVNDLYSYYLSKINKMPNTLSRPFGCVGI